MSVARIIFPISEIFPNVANSASEIFTLREDQNSIAFHHLRRVLRVVIGESVEILDSGGPTRLHGRVGGFSQGVIEIEALRFEQREEPPPIRVILGVPEFDRVEYLTEKLTELEAKEIVFFRAEHSQGKDCVEKLHKRLERLERICSSSRTQCGSRQSLTFGFYPSLISALAGVPPSRLKLLGSLSKSAIKLQEYLEKISLLEPIPHNADVSLIIGPEGGLTDEEELYTEKCGYIPVSFGSSILRVDTATICATFAMQHFLQSFREQHSAL